MNEIIKAILSGRHIKLDEFIDYFGKILKLLNLLQETSQDPKWHAEGSVFIHTQEVLSAVYQLLDNEASHLNSDQKLSLILAAIFHDIGKTLVTRTKQIDGIQRIISPYHDKRGCSYLAYRLLELNIPYHIVQQTLRLVLYHQQPKRLIKYNATKGAYFQLARSVNTELLYYLAKADILGRQCFNQQNECECIDLFKLFCQEYGLFGNENPYKEWRRFYDKKLESMLPENRDAVFGYAIQDFEQGLIFTPAEGIARRYSYLNSFPQLVIMSGPSGSGKSTWINNNLKDYQVISLDNLREEYGKKRSNQSQNSFILSKAKEQLKIHLRNHEKVVWDATNLRKDFRSMISQLGYNYHALVTLIVLHVPLASLYKGNQSRKDRVPIEVIDSQMNSLEWIENNEAHRIAFINHKQCLAQRGFGDPNNIFLK
jgi:predicted kinase